MSLSTVFSEAFYFFRNHLRQLALLTLPFIVVQLGIQYWLGGQFQAIDQNNPAFHTSHMVAVMAVLLVFSWFIAALTLFLEWRSQGYSPRNGQVLIGSLKFVPPLLLAGVFSALLIVAPSMLSAAFGPLWVIGLVLSIYLFARLAYVNFMVVTERLTPFEAIKASFRFANGTLVLKTMLVLLVYLPILQFGGLLIKLASAAGAPLQFVVEVLIAFIGLFVNIALFRLYMVNRKRAEAVQG